MSALALARWQFALTTVYHFFFVPLTLGLSILVAIMETQYVRTGDDVYKRMTKFWGKLFLINFAMGVATGIVQEFQFGMNWSEYSRFVGDVFGAPLAIEALMAFFLESTFLGIWIFGWDKLSRGMHVTAIWLVAIGSNLSALWILIANSFMHEPVGYTLSAATGRAEMTDFGALLTNPHVWLQFPHVFFSGLTTASFFVLGISAYHLLKNRESALFRRSLNLALAAGLIGAAMVGLVGHVQGQHVFRVQPMKMAAAEALWETEDPAALSLFSISNESQRREVFAITIPRLLSFLAYNKFTGEVRGINDLQAEYEQIYGPGNYVPPVTVSYWAFRIMLTLGLIMIGLGLLLLYFTLRKRLERQTWLLRIVPWVIPLPYLANSAGWILTEVGRQPWIVYGLMRTEQGASPAVSAGMVLTSILLFALLYLALMGANVYLLAKYARKAEDSEEQSPDLVGAEA